MQHKANLNKEEGEMEEDMLKKVFGGNGILHLVDKKNRAYCGEKYPSAMTDDEIWFLKQKNICEKCKSIATPINLTEIGF